MTKKENSRQSKFRGTQQKEIKNTEFDLNIRIG